MTKYLFLLNYIKMMEYDWLDKIARHHEQYPMRVTHPYYGAIYGIHNMESDIWDPYVFFHIWQVWKHYGNIMAIIFHTMENFFMEILWIWKKFIWPYYGGNRIFHNFTYYGKNFHTMENLWSSISHKFPYHIFFTRCGLTCKTFHYSVHSKMHVTFF